MVRLLLILYGVGCLFTGSSGISQVLRLQKDACCVWREGKGEGESKGGVKGGIKGNPPLKEQGERRIKDQGGARKSR